MSKVNKHDCYLLKRVSAKGALELIHSNLQYRTVVFIEMRFRKIKNHFLHININTGEPQLANIVTYEHSK